MTSESSDIFGAEQGGTDSSARNWAAPMSWVPSRVVRTYSGQRKAVPMSLVPRMAVQTYSGRS